MGCTDVDDLTQEIEDQITAGIESADVIVFVVDSQMGVTPLDQEVAKRLRYVDKPIICAANKTDSPKFDSEADDFYRLGRGKLVRASTTANRGRTDLLAMILERLPVVDPNATIELPEMKLAIVGRRNVGKSTFVNSLVNAERMIVSEIPGTTRDSVDVRFEMDGKAFVAIDTPGMRRRSSIRTDIDFYGTRRAERSIRRADVVLLFFECAQRIGKVDKQLCNYIADEYKPCLFVVNKWDKMHGQMPTEKWVTYLRDTFRTMWHVPIGFITGQTGKNVKLVLNHAQMLFKQSLERIGTSQLNSLIKSAIDNNPPPFYKQKRPKIYYATQVGTQPPTIVLMCNQPKAFSKTYRRYLLGVLRDQLSFGEVPIKLYLRRRASADDREDIESRFKSAPHLEDGAA